MTRNKLIVDTDIALLNDDAQALLILASFGVIPEAVTTVGGNVTAPLSARLTTWLYHTAGIGSPGVTIGANSPLKHKRMATYDHRHGFWGTDLPAAAPFPLPELTGQYSRQSAHQCIIDQSLMHGKIDLLCLGPLTNIALAISEDPGIPDRLGRVVIMGGVDLDLPPQKGNVTDEAEFNFWVDPHAANIVLRSPVKCELVTMNTSQPFWFSRKEAEDFFNLNTPLGHAFKMVYSQAIENIPGYKIPMYDQLAALLYLKPELFHADPFTLHVSTFPHSMGRCETRVTPLPPDGASQNTWHCHVSQMEEIKRILSAYYLEFK